MRRRRPGLVRATAVAVLGLLAGLAAPRIARAQDTDPLVEAATALRQGDRPAALEAAKRALAADPDSVPAHALRQDAARGSVPRTQLVAEYRTRAEERNDGPSAYLLARLQAPEEARTTLETAARRDAGAYWPRVGLADVLLRLGKRAKDVVGMAEEALSKRPDDPAAAARAGAQCAAAHDWVASEKHYRAAVDALADMQPADREGSVGARLGLAHALSRLGRTDEAAAIATALHDPRHPESRVLLLQAAVAFERRDEAAAEKALVQLSVADKNDQDARLQLAMLRLRRAERAAQAAGRPAVEEKAVAAELKDVRAVCEALPDRADARAALAYALEVVGKPEEAVEAWTTAANLDPLNPAIPSSLGALLLGMGRVEAAVAELERALDRDPDAIEPRFQYAVALDMLGDHRKAGAIHKKLVKEVEDDARFWHAWALNLESLDKLRDALKAHKEAVELEDGNARYHRDYGEALLSGGKVDDAVEQLETAVRLASDDVHAWSGLARALGADGKHADQAAAYERVVELRPEDKDLRLLLGALYQEELREYGKALVHYNRYRALGGEPANVEAWIAECEDALANQR